MEPQYSSFKQIQTYLGRTCVFKVFQVGSGTGFKQVEYTQVLPPYPTQESSDGVPSHDGIGVDDEVGALFTLAFGPFPERNLWTC